MSDQLKVAPVGIDIDADIELLKDEAGGLMMEFGITTITFFKGDFKTSSDALEQQLSVVVASNPWLAGRLVKTKAGKKVLRHPVNPGSSDIQTMFTAMSKSSASNDPAFHFTPSTPYVELCKGMYKSKKVIVPNGYDLVDKDRPVAMLTVAESTEGEFAVVFSMSHVIGDGNTYYEVFKMLQPGAAVRALKTERVMTFSDDMRDSFGIRKELEWADSLSAMLLYTFSMMFNSAPKCYAYYLDEEKLAKAKEDGKKGSGVEYVTTNDILTSGFMNVTKSRIGMMGMDCRNKGLKGVDTDLAGNYVTALVLDPDVFETPATLRQMFAERPYVTRKRPLPGCCCGNGRFSMVTNWSSFGGNLITLEGCEMVTHLPVQNPAYTVYDLMIPFTGGVDASGKAKKGVIIWAVSCDEAALKAALPLGESVSKELFPGSV